MFWIARIHPRPKLNFSTPNTQPSQQAWSVLSVPGDYTTLSCTTPIALAACGKDTNITIFRMKAFCCDMEHVGSLLGESLRLCWSLGFCPRVNVCRWSVQQLMTIRNPTLIACEDHNKRAFLPWWPLWLSAWSGLKCVECAWWLYNIVMHHADCPGCMWKRHEKTPTSPTFGWGDSLVAGSMLGFIWSLLWSSFLFLGLWLQSKGAGTWQGLMIIYIYVYIYNYIMWNSIWFSDNDQNVLFNEHWMGIIVSCSC